MEKQKIELDLAVNQIKEWHVPRLSAPKAISKLLPLQAKSVLERLYYLVMNPLKFRNEHIKYSQEWYDQVYHSADIYYLPERGYEEVMMQSKEMGEIDQLLESFSNFHLPQENKINWLEVACHHGKTPFTLANKYTNVHFYMFDFSKVAVEWCRKWNPIASRTTIWQGDIRHINYKGNSFDAFFDVITCLDVTEHLPRRVYVRAIKEMHRVCKPRGLLVLKQGNVPLREHINILDEVVLVRDFERRGFSQIDELPNRCHLLQCVC